MWQAKLAANADAARLAGSEATSKVLELVAKMDAAFDVLGARLLTDLAVNRTYPEDFYDAFDARLQDSLVRRRAARAAAGHDVLDP